MGKLAKSASTVIPKIQSKDKKEHPTVEVTDSLIDMKSPVQILNRGFSSFKHAFHFIVEIFLFIVIVFVDETPERIELENQTHDPSFSEENCEHEMDEDVWSDYNFGTSLAVDNESRLLKKIFEFQTCIRRNVLILIFFIVKMTMVRIALPKTKIIRKLSTMNRTKVMMICPVNFSLFSYHYLIKILRI